MRKTTPNCSSIALANRWFSSSPRPTTHTIESRFRLAFIACLFMFTVHAGSAVAQNQSDSIITRTVVAKPGDTLRSIALKELGKSGLAPMLANFNAMNETDSVFEGQIIRIPLFAPVERQFATVIFVKGNVTRDNKPVARNDKIYLNELVITGDDGFASLQFASGSVINMQPKTHAKLEKINCLKTDESCLIVLDSAQGEVSSDVTRREGQPTEFTINTPYASAAVRGTFFEIGGSETEMTIGVTDGDVMLNSGNNAVALPVGFGSVAKPDARPADPIALLPAPVYRFIPTRAAAGDTIAWWALTDVDGYLVDLSVDEAGREVVASYAETRGVLQIADLNAGEYVMNVRGVDANGLKGFKTPTKLIVAAIDDGIEPVDTKVSRVGNEFVVEVIDPPETAPGYEIQISSDISFIAPLSVDVANPGTAVFRLESDKVYTRARVLVDPELVSAFGTVAESN